MAAIDIGAEDKKKLYILGGLVGVFVIGLLVFKPFGGRRTSTSQTTVSTTGTATNSASPMMPSGGTLTGMTSPSAPSSSTVTATTGGASSGYISFPQARRDPFVPHYVPALPPTPRPPAPRPPLQPLNIPGPGEYSGGASFPDGNGFTSLPPARIASRGDNAVLSNLPQVRIPQYTPRTSPRVTSSNPYAGAGGGSESTSARLAGVVIGDSVRALVEVTTPSGTIVSRVVQPGDEIEGIRILRLERVEEGGQSVTRMTVSQNGREQYFTLRPSGSPRANSGFGGGLGTGLPGSLGMPGTFGAPPNNGFVQDDGS